MIPRLRGGSDDIDLDRTVEQLAEHPVPEDEDIVVRERVRTRRSVVLLVDLSRVYAGQARAAARQDRRVPARTGTLVDYGALARGPRDPGQFHVATRRLTPRRCSGLTW